MSEIIPTDYKKKAQLAFFLMKVLVELFMNLKWLSPVNPLQLPFRM